MHQHRRSPALSGWRSARRRRLALACALSVSAAVAIAIQTDFQAPPRFDGAGYAVLAESLRTGHGYRAIDHPDAPEHAHFPPAYPIALAGIWSLFGPRVEVAHFFSLVCTAAAVGLTFLWLLRSVSGVVAFVLTCAVALNWTWIQVGGTIQSEPLFLLICALALLTHNWSTHGPAWGGAVTGLLLALATLTRQVGVTLVVALALDLLLGRKPRHMFAMLAAFAALISPWAAWLATHREATQVGLLPRAGLQTVIWNNAIFYLRRIPDAIAGPFVESATVYHPEFAWPATLLAGGVALVVILGWIAAFRSRRRRVLGCVPIITLGALLVWPFTEAGRFLIPLVPFLLVGAWSGLVFITRCIPRVRARTLVIQNALAVGLLLVSVPYPAYTGVRKLARNDSSMTSDFDAACRWIAASTNRGGPIIVRQAGEAFWLVGKNRKCLAPSSDPALIPDEIRKYKVVYLIDDEQRYSNAARSPISRYVNENPDAVRLVYESGAIRVYETIAPKSH